MTDLADHKAGSLPYGAQRRLEIVRALATDPSLLLLDEPAAGMNPSETAELMENIRKIRDEFQIAVMLIEHDTVSYTHLFSHNVHGLLKPILAIAVCLFVGIVHIGLAFQSESGEEEEEE